MQLFFIRYPSYKRLTAWQCTYLYFCRFVNNGLVKLVKTCWIYSSSFNKSAGHLNVLNTMFLVPSRVNYNKDLIDQPFFWIKLLYASDKCTALVSGDYCDDGKHWSTGFLTGNYSLPLRPTGLLSVLPLNQTFTSKEKKVNDRQSK